MGLIAKIISFTRATRKGAHITDVRADPGPGNRITAEHSGAPGDDSFPLSTDYTVLLDAGGTGRYIAVGYFDTINTPLANVGEKRIYSRKSDGSIIASVWLKNTGEVIIRNENGSFKMLPNGKIVANGATIETNGDVVTPDGISLRNHTHIGNLGVATSAPVPQGV